MPIYDCGDPECGECKRAFGPDRSKAIENYRRREKAYAELNRTGGKWFEATYLDEVGVIPNL